MKNVAALIAIFCLLASAERAQPLSPKPPPDLCAPNDRVVWLDTKNRIYHISGDPEFGHTDGGHFMCQEAADRERDQAAAPGNQ